MPKHFKEVIKSNFVTLIDDILIIFLSIYLTVFLKLCALFRVFVVKLSLFSYPSLMSIIPFV